MLGEAKTTNQTNPAQNIYQNAENAYEIIEIFFIGGAYEKEKTIGCMLALFALAMLLFTTVVNAAESDSVVSGEKMQYISAISTPGGTTRLSFDNLRGNLNCKSSKAKDYWLYASFTTNADEAITGIWIKTSGSVTTIDGYAVTRASDNVNEASKTACYIYYTKDKKAGAPIASVGVWQSEDEYFEYRQYIVFC